MRASGRARGEGDELHRGARPPLREGQVNGATYGMRPREGRTSAHIRGHERPAVQANRGHGTPVRNQLTYSQVKEGSGTRLKTRAAFKNRPCMFTKNGEQVTCSEGDNLASIYVTGHCLLWNLLVALPTGPCRINAFSAPVSRLHTDTQRQCGGDTFSVRI